VKHKTNGAKTQANRYFRRDAMGIVGGLVCLTTDRVDAESAMRAVGRSVGRSVGISNLTARIADGKSTNAKLAPPCGRLPGKSATNACIGEMNMCDMNEERGRLLHDEAVNKKPQQIARSTSTARQTSRDDEMDLSPARSTCQGEMKQ
jgi:hypothetical protein